MERSAVLCSGEGAEAHACPLLAGLRLLLGGHAGQPPWEVVREVIKSYTLAHR